MLNINLIKIVNSLSLKHPVTQISKDLGISKGTVSSYYNGNIKASEPFLEKFANFYKVSLEELKDDFVSEVETGFYYPEVTASAGLETGMQNDELKRIPINIPGWEKGIDFINVYGDSMYPKYCSGEIIGIKEVEPQYLNYGYAYVVILNDGQVFLKYIQKGKDEFHWVLASENSKYESKEYHLKLIKKVFIIKGVISKTTM